MIHIDGDHTEHGAYTDINNFWNALNIGGHMLIDDSIYHPEVRRAIQRFLTLVNEPNYESRNLRGTWLIQKTKPLEFPLITN
jgi:hypothetical protein